MCTVTLNTYIYCQELAEFQVPRIFNGKVPSYQLRKLNSIRAVYRGSIYPPLAQFASDSDIHCQHFGVTRVRKRFHSGGSWYLLKAECLAFHCADGEEGGHGLCLSGMNIFGEHTPGQGSRVQPRTGLSNQRVLISVNQPRTSPVSTSTGKPHTFS